MRHLVTIVSIAALALAGCESAGNTQSARQSEVSDQNTEKVQTLEPGHAEGVDYSDDAEQRLEPGDVPPVGSRFELSEKEWRERLTEEEFEVLRQEGTEPAGSGDLLGNKKKGIYYCAGCGAPLFSSQHKYDSSTGWPSFYRTYNPKRIGTKLDRSMGMKRTEVHCARCGGHLGHVFDDGPEPTGRRYCINSVALDFRSVDEIQADSAEGNESTDDDEPATE